MSLRVECVCRPDILRLQKSVAPFLFIYGQKSKKSKKNPLFFLSLLFSRIPYAKTRKGIVRRRDGVNRVAEVSVDFLFRVRLTSCGLCFVWMFFFDTDIAGRLVQWSVEAPPHASPP